MIVVPGSVISSNGELQYIVVDGAEPDSVLASAIIISVVVTEVVKVVVLVSVVAFVVESNNKMIILNHNRI